MDILEQFENPNYLENLTGKSVSITTIDNEVHKGSVYAIDPISKTIVLIQSTGENKILKIVMYHAVKDFKLAPEVEVIYDKTFTEPLFEQDVEDRRVKLRNWFRKNLIDVTEDGKLLKVQDDFSIGPPYTISQCVSSNSIILERMIQLIEKMP